MVSRNETLVRKIEEEKRNLVMGAIGEGKTFEEIVKTLKNKVSRSTITKHLRELEKSGYVIRVPIPGKRRVEYRLTEKFKETDYYQMKALALKEFLDLRKFIGDADGFAQRIGETVCFFTLLACTDKHNLEKYNIALFSYIRLLSMLVVNGLNPEYEASKIAKQNMDKVRRYIESYTKHDIEKLLNTVENEKEREQIKKVLFST